MVNPPVAMVEVAMVEVALNAETVKMPLNVGAPLMVKGPVSVPPERRR